MNGENWAKEGRGPGTSRGTDSRYPDLSEIQHAANIELHVLTGISPVQVFIRSTRPCNKYDRYWLLFLLDFKYHVPCTDGKISVRIIYKYHVSCNDGKISVRIILNIMFHALMGKFQLELF